MAYFHFHLCTLTGVVVGGWGVDSLKLCSAGKILSAVSVISWTSLLVRACSRGDSRGTREQWKYARLTMRPLSSGLDTVGVKNWRQ